MSAPLQQPGTREDEVLEYVPEGAAAQQAQVQMLVPVGNVLDPPLAAPYPLHASSSLPSTSANPAAAQDLHRGVQDTAATLPSDVMGSYVVSQPVPGPPTPAYAGPREASPSSASTKILDWQTAVIQSQQQQLHPPAGSLTASIPSSQSYPRPEAPVQSFSALGWPPPPQQQQPVAYSFIQSAPPLPYFGSEGHITSVPVPSHGIASNLAPIPGSSPAESTPIGPAPNAPTSAYRTGIPPSSAQVSSSPGNHPQVIHFHPPAPAVATFVDRAQAVTPTRPGPIDLNPSRTLLRGPGPQVVRVGEQANPSFSNVLYAYQLPHSLQQPAPSRVPPYPHGDPAVAEASISAPSNVASIGDQRRHSSFASWEGMPMAMSSPAGPVRSRLRSASNVRGAPNEANDGSPARSFWHPHGRMGTMDSIASSQWSPAVTETYRFVDPLQPQQANPDPATTRPVSSPVKVARPMIAIGPSVRRMSSGLVPQTVSMISPTTEISPTSSVALSGQQQQPATVSTSFFPSYPASESSFFRQGYRQAVEPRGSIASTSTASTNYEPIRFANHQIYLGEDDDPESRRASTATSFSSASLVSPTGGQSDLLSRPNPLAASQLYPNSGDTSQSHLLAIPSSSLGYRGYRDYLLDIYGNPQSATGYPMIFADLQVPKEGSPLSAGPTPSPTGTHTPLPSGSDSGLAPPASARAHSVEAPVAQLQRQTLNDTSQPPPTGMPRRKRTLSGRQTLETLPIIAVPKPSMAPRSQSANDTLAPTSNPPYRRLSSPVLSVRPSSGDEEALIDEDEDDDDEQEAEATFDVTGQGSGDLQFVDTSGSFVYGISPGSSVGYLQLPQASSQASTSRQRIAQASASNSSSQGGMIPVPATRQPFHPVPESGPVNLVRSLPDDEDDPELGRPRRQKLRFEGDYYTPEWVKGEAAKKEGFCDLCHPGKWLQLKNSAFWYHRQYTHGISSVSGQPFTKPVSFRQLPGEGATEGLCHQCNTWIMYTTKKQNSSEDESQKVPTNWYKHAHKCHFYMASRSRSERPRGKRRKISDSPEP